MSGYYAIKKKVRNQRYKWLEEKNKVTSEEAHLEKTLETIKQSQKNTLYRRIQQQKCAKHISQRKLAQEYKELKEREAIQTMKYSKQTSKIEFPRSQTFVKARPVLYEAEKDQIVTSTFYGRIPLKEYRAKIHPPSKLILSNKEQLFEKQVTMKVDEKLIKSDIEKAYKLEVLRDQRLIDKDKFVATYSTGPFFKHGQVAHM